MNKVKFLWVLLVFWLFGCDHVQRVTEETDAMDSGSEIDSKDPQGTDLGLDTDDDSSIDTEDDGYFDDPLIADDSIFSDPGQFVEIIPGFADFWKPMKDDVHGGFYNYVEQDGTPSSVSKAMVPQSRLAWGFARAFMITGQEEYLDYAEHALDFLYTHAWDSANDGWFYHLLEDGTVGGHAENGRKWSFGQHYALLGVSAMVEATQEPLHRQWLMKGWNSNETHMWDPDPVNYGYYEFAADDWSNARGKGFTPTADGITTNVLAMYLAANEQAGKNRMEQFGHTIHDRFITSGTAPEQVLFGLVESYNTDWSGSFSTWGLVGHVLKTGWCLARAHLVTGHRGSDWTDRAGELLLDVWNNAYDHTYGAPYGSTFSWSSTTFGISTSSMEYWQVEQAVTAGLMNFYASKDTENRKIFLHMAEESMQFFLDNFIDEQYGEIFTTTSPDGTPMNTDKGDVYKSAYHGIETLYYGYLYGSFFYSGTPVELYYRFLPDDDMSVKLTPCAIENHRLEIVSVERDGEPYNDFDAQQRILNVSAQSGGVFKVTYLRR